MPEVMTISSNGFWHLSLPENLFVGGVNHVDKLPMDLKSKPFFMGCIQRVSTHTQTQTPKNHNRKTDTNTNKHDNKLKTHWTFTITFVFYCHKIDWNKWPPIVHNLGGPGWYKHRQLSACLCGTTLWSPLRVCASNGKLWMPLQCLQWTMQQSQDGGTLEEHKAWHGCGCGRWWWW